jgi:hypothetical protein
MRGNCERLIAAMTALTVSACGSTGIMLPGSIYSNDGKVLQFEIEKASRTGAVKALDPATGEQFSGTYVGLMPTVTATSSAMISGASTTGRHVNASGFGVNSVSSNIANTTAYLKGDKGTMLNCTMEIEAAIGSPHGIGGCDDNFGKKYRLQF